MNDIWLLLISFSAGLFGSLLGLGGGMILTPLLTLINHMEVKTVLGISLICVIATSVGATLSNLKENVVHIRLGIILSTATVLGAVLGLIIEPFIPGSFVSILFGCLLLYSSISMLKTKVKTATDSQGVLPHEYYDTYLQQKISYTVQRLKTGWIFMLMAGSVSSVLGIGSGSFKVLALDQWMKVPTKASSATSNFIMGMTASVGAIYYFMHYNLEVYSLFCVILGVLFGAQIGAFSMRKTNANSLRKWLIPILVWVSLQMIWKGWRG